MDDTLPRFHVEITQIKSVCVPLKEYIQRFDTSNPTRLPKEDDVEHLRGQIVILLGYLSDAHLQAYASESDDLYQRTLVIEEVSRTCYSLMRKALKLETYLRNLL